MHSLMMKTTTSSCSSFLLPSSSSSLPSSRSSSSLERSLKFVLILLCCFCCFCSTDNVTHGFTTSTTEIKITSSSSSSSIIRIRNRIRNRSNINSPISSSSSSNNRNFFLSMSGGGGGVDDDDDDEKKVKAIWTNLVPEDDTAPVRLRRILTEKKISSSSSSLLSTRTKDDDTDSTAATSASLLKPGSTVRIEYVGRLVMDTDNDNENNCFGSGSGSGSGSMGGISSWTTQDVLECWLKEQQGLYELLADSFQEHNITGSILLDETIFTEQYVSELSNTTILSKIQCKKTIMAVKRLRHTMNEYQHEYIFDSSKTNPNLQPHQYYEFIINHPKKKPIKAISLLLSSSLIREDDIGNTLFTIQCRSNYGYGSDGYRTNKGIIVVPPFATLQFDIKLLSVDHLPL